jgi:hypothetical protein
MKRTYLFDYDCGEASATFVVDTEKFTPEMAKETLDFYYWDYDKEADPVTEVLRKYALQAIVFATSTERGLNGVLDEWKHLEAFHPIDTDIVKLIEVSGYEFDEEKLEMKIVNA